MGSVGIEMAPPRIISSAQTVAKMGRLMKNSTNMPPWAFIGEPRDRCRRGSGRDSLLGYHRRPIHQILRPRDNNAIPGLNPIQHNVVVADHLPHAYLSLPGYKRSASPSATNAKNCPLMRETASTGISRPSREL